MENGMEKENGIGLMDLSILVNLNMVNSMVRGLWFGPVVKNILDNTRKENKMEKVQDHGVVVKHILVILKMINFMVMEKCYMLMVNNTKDNGKMDIRKNEEED